MCHRLSTTTLLMSMVLMQQASAYTGVILILLLDQSQSMNIKSLSTMASKMPRSRRPYDESQIAWNKRSRTNGSRLSCMLIQLMCQSSRWSVLLKQLWDQQVLLSQRIRSTRRSIIKSSTLILHTWLISTTVWNVSISWKTTSMNVGSLSHLSLSSSKCSKSMASTIHTKVG